jgi:hypothetical protein
MKGKSENNKIREKEIIGTKKKIEMINITKNWFCEKKSAKLTNLWLD